VVGGDVVVVVVVLLVVGFVGAARGAGGPPHEAKVQAAANRAQAAGTGRRRSPTLQIMAEPPGGFWSPAAGIHPSMARAPSLTHDLVVLQQHNGELQEDVMERSIAAGGWLDAEIGDSFPASDPLSHWAGPRRRESEADRAHGHVVHRRPVEDATERRDPDEPIPGTLAP